MSNIRFSERLTQTQGLRFAREPRYDCPECCDTGWVSIWKPKTIQAAIEDPDSCVWDSCVCLCYCEAAEKNVKQIRERRRTRDIPVFKESDWHINTHWRDSKVRAATYEYKHPNYNDAFAGMDGAA